MSHPGNDEIIDNERDNLRITLTQKMTYAAIELGIGVVQEIAAETIKRRPGMSVKEFMKVLDEYLVQQKAQANSNS
tara:strand:- start:117 stop:344 length:228 start_codon:yes stop_codon:yes gene_type:complete